jgi:hypothetical protein
MLAITSPTSGGRSRTQTMVFLWFSQQTVNVYMNSINRLVFVIEMWRVFSAEETEINYDVV